MTTKRYTKLNNFYIQDNKTGQKLDQKRTIKRLNNYEIHKLNQKENIINQLKKENQQLKLQIKELEKEKYRLNSKVNRLIDELANCYEKLGW